MATLKKVHVTQDDFGHWFVLSAELADDFNEMLDKLINCDFEDSELLE